MTPKQMSVLAAAAKAEQIVDELFSGTPVVFTGGPPREYERFREQLSNNLGCQAGAIWVVGSGRFGFSMAPHKFGKPFHMRSDVDVAIVDDRLFDEVWGHLTRYDFKSLTFDADITASLWEHRNNNIFWGYIEPYRLKAAIPSYSRVWHPSFAALSFFRSIAGRTVKSRLYRNMTFAREYHLYGLRLIAAKEKGKI